MFYEALLSSAIRQQGKSKRVFQENKARQIFRKTNISYPLIRTHYFSRFIFCWHFTRLKPHERTLQNKLGEYWSYCT